MLEVLVLALALSMDAFAVSIGLGTKNKNTPILLGMKAGLYFGLFQGLMPLIGYLAGQSLLGWIGVYAAWIAFVLLFVIGAKMIFDAYSDDIEEGIGRLSHKMMLALAFATSVDAMAAGFTLNLLEANPFISCIIIGVMTFFVSWMGVLSGIYTGTYFEKKAEVLGGTVLILIGFKFLFF